MSRDDEPVPIECGRCAPSTVTGARPKFTDNPGGRRGHLRVFSHAPAPVPPPTREDTPA